MKTILRCFQEAGEKFPFSIRRNKQNGYFHIVAQAPDSRWVGWNEQGHVEFSYGDTSIWSLYTAPKPKVKMWPALIKNKDNGHFHRTGSLHPDEASAKAFWKEEFIRPITEYPPVEVEVE